MNAEHVTRLLEELKTLNDNFSRVTREKESIIEANLLLRRRINELETNSVTLLENISDLRVAAARTDAYYCSAIRVANAALDRMRMDLVSSRMQAMTLMHQNEELKWQNMPK